MLPGTEKVHLIQSLLIVKSRMELTVHYKYACKQLENV